MKDGSVAMTGTLKSALGTAALPGLTFSGDTDTGISAATANTLGFSTAGAQRLTIDSSGYVGINTSGPTAPLTVNYPSANSTVTNPIIKMNNPGGSQSGFTFTFSDVLKSQIRADNNGNMVFASTGTQLFGYPTDFSVANDMQFGGPYNGATPPMYVKGSGGVGIGTATPRSALDVGAGTFLMAPAVSASATVNFANGNIQYTTSDCGAYQFNNLKDGGAYTFVVKGSTSATCSFTAYSDAGSTALTVKMPPDHAATTANKYTLYSLIVVGTDVIVAWTPGY